MSLKPREKAIVSIAAGAGVLGALYLAWRVFGKSGKSMGRGRAGQNANTEDEMEESSLGTDSCFVGHFGPNGRQIDSGVCAESEKYREFAQALREEVSGATSLDRTKLLRLREAMVELARAQLLQNQANWLVDRRRLLKNIAAWSEAFLRHEEELQALLDHAARQLCTDLGLGPEIYFSFHKALLQVDQTYAIGCIRLVERVRASLALRKAPLEREELLQALKTELSLTKTVPLEAFKAPPLKKVILKRHFIKETVAAKMDFQDGDVTPELLRDPQVAETLKEVHKQYLSDADQGISFPN